jgi:hypothetical protein
MVVRADDRVRSCAAATACYRERPTYVSTTLVSVPCTCIPARSLFADLAGGGRTISSRDRRGIRGLHKSHHLGG